MHDFLQLYRRVLLLLRPERGVALALVAANVVLALLVFVEPSLFGRIVDVLARSDGRPPADVWADSLFWLSIWGGFGSVGIVASILLSLQADRLAHRRRLAAMGQFFTHVLDLPPAFHGATHSGRLIKVALTGSDHLFGLYLSFFREHLSTLFAVAVLLPLALWSNWRLGLLLVVLTSVFAVLITVVIRGTERRQRAVEGHHSELAAQAGDVLGNVVLVQTFLRLSAEARSLDTTMRRVLAAQYPVLTWWAFATVLARAASTITVLAIFALGAWLHLKGLASVGEIVSFMGFATLLIGRLEQALGFVNRLFLQKDGLAQYFEILDTRSAIREHPRAVRLPRPDGRIRFDKVGLSYDGRRPAVTALEIDIRQGQHVALVGPTGAGKTTTMALLMRLFDPDAGRILIDGIDIKDVTLDSLRAGIGAVFQESLLFNRTIEDNLRVGRPEASWAEIEAAARAAEAHDFITARPHGYQTIVGERGVGFSGGERQRLAIARLMLKDAPILLLDEATSALDAVTEARIQAALRRLRHGRTSLVIAHRLSTIRDADLILVFEHGRIVERGSFKTLVAANGRFAHQVRMQSGADSSPLAAVLS